MKFHPAVVAITSVLFGLSAVSFAASLTLVRPVAQVLSPVLTVPSLVVREVEKPTLVETTGAIIVLPEVIVKAPAAVKRAPEPKLVERCREVELMQGAGAGQTVVFCETVSE